MSELYAFRCVVIKKGRRVSQEPVAYYGQGNVPREGLEGSLRQGSEVNCERERERLSQRGFFNKAHRQSKNEREELYLVNVNVNVNIHVV